jgi:rhodanese-related sulfurtransferase
VFHLNVYFAGVSSVVLLDVRQPSEVAEACVADADAGGRKVLYVPVTLDDSSAMSEAFLASHQLAKDQALVVFCRSGRRAGVAKAALEALGCTAVTNGGTVDDVKAALLAGAKAGAFNTMATLFGGINSMIHTLFII